MVNLSSVSRYVSQSSMVNFFGGIMVTPCRVFGCPNHVTRSQNGYCDVHADKRTGWAKTQERKGNTTERGYGHAWRKLRTQVLERDGYLCQACKAKGRITPATDVDHIVNKASGGTDDIDNLQALCRACHKAKTQAESQCQRSG